MLEQIQPIQIVLAVLATLGARELLAMVLRAVLGRKKDRAELTGLEIVNAGASMHGLQDALKNVAALTTQAQTQLEVIARLESQKVLDKQRIDQRDGVISYQEKEITRLHEDVAELRTSERACRDRMMELEKRVQDLEIVSRDMPVLKEISDSATRQNLQMKAILRDLRLQGKWEGDENAIAT